MNFKRISLLFLLIFNLNFAKDIKRIITVSHFSTVILVQLGQEDKLVGEAWSAGVVFPKEIQEKIKNVPKLSNKIPTKEKVYSLSPDLLVGWQGAFRDKNLGPQKNLEDAGIKTFYFKSSKPFGNIEIFFEDLRNLGKILSIEDKVEKKIKEISDILKNLETKEKKETIVFISNIDLTPSVIGGKSLLQSILDKSGYKNIFEDVEKNYFNTPWETIISKKIDNIVIMSKDEKDFIQKYKKLKASNYFNDKKAMKNGNIFYLNYIDAAPNLNIGLTAQKLNQKTLKKIGDFYSH